MNENFRPSTLGEILDKTAQIFRRNFGLFVGIAAVPIGVMVAFAVVGVIVLFLVPGLSGLGTGNIGVGPAAIAAVVIAILGILVAIPVYLGAYVYSSAGLTQAVVSSQFGEKLTIRGALASVRPRFWSYFGLTFLQGALVVLVPGITAGGIIGALIFLMSQAGTGASVALGFLAFLVGVAAFVAIVWLALGYAMGMAVSVVEKKPAWDSFQRASQLTQGSRGRIFVLYLLLAVLSGVVSMVAYIPFVIVIFLITFLGKGSHSATAAMAIAEVVYYVINLSLQILVAPVPRIALVLFYYDQRIRKEGFDIEMMMQNAGMVPPPPPPPPPPFAVHPGFFPPNFPPPAAPAPDAAGPSPPPPIPSDTAGEA